MQLIDTVIEFGSSDGHKAMCSPYLGAERKQLEFSASCAFMRVLLSGIPYLYDV